MRLFTVSLALLIFSVEFDVIGTDESDGIPKNIILFYEKENNY